MRFVKVDNTTIVWRKKFSIGRIAAFSKTCVFNNISGPKKWSFYYHSNCQNIFLALINPFLKFDTLDNLRKNGANTFVHWKTAFFSKVCVFSNLLGPQKELITSTLKIRISFWLFWMVFWALSISTIRKIIGQIHFLTEKIAFFQKKCVLNNLLGSQRIDLIICTNIAMIRCGT